MAVLSAGVMVMVAFAGMTPSGAGGAAGPVNVTSSAADVLGLSAPGNAPRTNWAGRAGVTPVTVNGPVPLFLIVTLSAADPLISTFHDNTVGCTSIQGCAVPASVDDTTQVNSRVPSLF